MIGRGAQGRPWLPGQIGRALKGGAIEPAPVLARQYEIVSTLYEEMLIHYGSAVGRRHARKHLGWALEAAAVTAGAPAEALKHHRANVLTAEEPAQAKLRLKHAFDAFTWRTAA
jgi:tRNA-dihydrouridine synthase B